MLKLNNIAKKSVFMIFGLCLYSILLASALYALEQTITVPAEKPQGIEVDLPKGEYVVKIEGGAIALCYPINPNYKWLIGVAVGTDVEGHQDVPNMGTLYFEPNPPVRNQAEAESQALQAVKENTPGTSLKFTLTENKKVRFWASDYDYSDNSGMVKLKVSSI